MTQRTTLYLFFQFLILASLPAQEINPYLQSPTDTSIRITWKTSSDPDTRVIYGMDSSNMFSVVNGECVILSDTGYNHNYFYHDALITGLEPGSLYYYKVFTGTSKSKAYRFRTQPPKGINPGVYRVLVLGDHQLKDNDHYQKLMLAAREKVFEKFGGTIEENINLIVNDGDQVDEGTLDQYEYVHFKPSSILSGNIPIMTTVGNHEFYGSMGMSAYYPHFFYDGPGYKGIISPGGENYYSYQQGSVVFVHLSSEHTTNEQILWVQQIVDSVKSDSSVKWLVSIAHRPIQAEQFVGDISFYVREKVIPILAQTEKSTLFIAGHHHLYARGQVRDFPIYHIISGAASWDQYWGQSVEQDFDDVQKTIDYWAYQIVSFDDTKNEMLVESYAIGSPRLGLSMTNELIDSFYRKPGLPSPDKPMIVTVPQDSVSLPFTFESSLYSSSALETFNSTWFQISTDSVFSKPAIDLIRDYENLYGTTGAPDYRPVDIHKGVNIFQYVIGSNKLPNGTYFIRTRHRDRNIEWSEWSDIVKFKVRGSMGGFASISLTKEIYLTNENIPVNYRYGPGNEKDWIGIYKEGDLPGQTGATAWKYTNGTEGVVNLMIGQTGKYFIAFFENDGYKEISERLPVYIRSVPVITLNRAGFASGDEILINYKNAPGLPKDWIGIYKLGDNPGQADSVKFNFVSGAEGNLSFYILEPGYYFISYFLQGGFTEATGKNIFSVGSEIAQVNTDQVYYQNGSPINVYFENGPGTSGDWIGIFRQNTSPGIPPLVTRQFIRNLQSGSITFNALSEAGEYYIAMCINNSSVRISNKANFTIQQSPDRIDQNSGHESFTVFPSPSKGAIILKTPEVQNSEMHFKIISLQGTTVYEITVQASNSLNSGEIDVSSIPSGTYIIVLKTGEKVFFKKLILL